MVEPHFGFSPLERRGVFLGLGVAQLLTLAAGAVLGLVARAAVRGLAGDATGILGFAAAAGAALWSRQGRPAGAWLATAAAWLARRAAGPILDDRPTVGVPGVSGRAGASTRRGPAPAGIELIEERLGPTDPPLGVVRDRRAGTWAAVLPVGGISLPLLDPSEQVQRLDGWRQVLGAVARPGSPVVRLQWVRRCWSGDPGAMQETLGLVGCPPGRPGVAPADRARASYESLARSALPSMAVHGSWIVVVVRGAASGGHCRGTADRVDRSASGLMALRREARLLQGQLRVAGLEPGAPMTLEALAGLLAGVGERGGAIPEGGRRCGPWPLATEERWGEYRADGTWHATYWVAEWPRIEVGPDFLEPLLVRAPRSSLSVVMAPIPADRAMREVRSARTADLADSRLRERAGFLESARREREADGVVRREAELADGHDEFRFSSYLTVSADDPEQLRAACIEAEHAAQSARLEMRRLYGRQAEAFSWTLPLGRGLR